jgi:hypothetical protein
VLFIGTQFSILYTETCEGGGRGEREAGSHFTTPTYTTGKDSPLSEVSLREGEREGELYKEPWSITGGLYAVVYNCV